MLRAGPLLAATLLSACSGSTAEAPAAPPDEGATSAVAAAADLPPTARPDTLESLRADLALERDPSDGGGRGWLEQAEGVEERVVVGRPHRWVLVYEAGPEGVAVGGTIQLQVPPFWGWGTPQADDPDERGYTEVTTEAEGVELTATTPDRQLLAVEVGGRALAEGERVRLVFGAGPARAQTDRFAERESRFWFRVDGDGDGVSALVADSPTVEIEAGPPDRVVVTLPSTAVVGEEVRVAVAVLDAMGNAGCRFAGELTVAGLTDGLELPDAVELTEAQRGVTSVTAKVLRDGLHVVTARVESADGIALEGLSNPMLASDRPAPILWADLHGHSNFSDGTGTPEDYYRYARDVSALDVAALTDHDHWGMPFLDRTPEMWERIEAATKAAHEPGRFVTLLGYEWTNWIHGHRHVLYFSDHGKVLSSVDPDYETPRQLWDALAGLDALTFAHHSAGGPIATNWDYPPDPVLEPVTEIVSVHGSSEAWDSPQRIYSPVRGNFARDALDRGYRLGFLGSGDSHDGHPGLAHLASPSGGLAAIVGAERTRASVLEALRARRVYATNGARILLRTGLDGHRMGSLVPVPADGAAAKLVIWTVGTGPIDTVDVIRSGEPVSRYDCGGQLEVSTTVELEGLGSGDYVYVRVIQSDGGMAWSSPFFFD